MKLIKTDQKNELIHSVRKGDHVQNLPNDIYNFIGRHLRKTCLLFLWKTG